MRGFNELKKGRRRKYYSDCGICGIRVTANFKVACTEMMDKHHREKHYPEDDSCNINSKKGQFKDRMGNYLDNFERKGKSAICKMCHSKFDVSAKGSPKVWKKMKSHLESHLEVDAQLKQDAIATPATEALREVDENVHDKDSRRLHKRNRTLAEWKIAHTNPQISEKNFLPTDCYFVTEIQLGEVEASKAIKEASKVYKDSLELKLTEAFSTKCGCGPGGSGMSGTIKSLYNRSISIYKHLIPFCMGVQFRSLGNVKYAIEEFEKSIADVEHEFLEEVGVSYLNLIGLYSKLGDRKELVRCANLLRSYMEETFPGCEHYYEGPRICERGCGRVHIVMSSLGNFETHKCCRRCRDEALVFHLIITHWSIKREDIEIFLYVFLKTTKTIKSRRLDPKLHDAIQRCDNSMKIGKFFKSKLKV